MREYYKDTMPSKGGQPSRSPPADREITFAEFEKRFMAKLRSEQDPHGHHKEFMRLDLDGNLKLSRKEMQRMKEL